jgi:MFS family permease
VGAALGALTLAAIGQRFPRERVAFAAGIGLGLSVLLLGMARSYPLAAGLLVAVGLCMALNAIMTNTILQTDAPDHLRGQVVGLYAFIVIGMAPFGSAQAAWIGERFGPSLAIAVGGAICLLAAGLVSWRVGFFGRPEVRAAPAALAPVGPEGRPGPGGGTR